MVLATCPGSEKILHARILASFVPAMPATARGLIHSRQTTEDKERSEMLLNHLLALTDNRKRMVLLTVLTFLTLC